MKKAKLILKALLSLWIVYNIFSMMVMPNISSYYGRVTSKYIGPYVNTIGLNAGWNFFSPEPAHPMYLRYTVHFDDKDGNEVKESIYDTIPNSETDALRPVPTITLKREWAQMRFMVIDQKRLRVLVGPWFCRQFPGATSIDMEHVVEMIPFLDTAVTNRGEDLSELSKEMQYNKQSILCSGEGADEEAL